MGFIVSLIAIAVGAILRWAVTAQADGVNITTIGLIVLVIGIAGLVFSIVDYLGWWTWRTRRTTPVVHEVPAPVVRERQIDRTNEPL